jgi:hypothetical protein
VIGGGEEMLQGENDPVVDVVHGVPVADGLVVPDLDEGLMALEDLHGLRYDCGIARSAKRGQSRPQRKHGRAAAARFSTSKEKKRKRTAVQLHTLARTHPVKLAGRIAVVYMPSLPFACMVMISPFALLNP